MDRFLREQFERFLAAVDTALARLVRVVVIRGNFLVVVERLFPDSVDAVEKRLLGRRG